MDTAVIDERDMFKQFQKVIKERFLKFVKDYDDFIAPSMRAKGYTLKNQSSRTVTFIFGEIEFSRNRWYKGGKCRIPVDEKLGLEKHSRFSREMVYQLAHLATFLPYRKVGTVLELINQTIVTKDNVLKAVKKGNQLHQMKEDYDYFQDEAPQKIVADKVYLEGDGAMVKTTDHSQENYNTDLAHFVIHTGRKQVGPNRYELQNKKEFISSSHFKARQQTLDYLYHHFEFSDQTILICNSDGGHGYGQAAFKEFGKALGIKQVEYFWDAYHLNEALKQFFQPYPQELLEFVFKGIRKHKKKYLRTAFDTLESLIDDDEELEAMLKFKRKLLSRFAQTKPAHLRGLSHKGIGIMESQHRKITYRMKKRGMYWSLAGAETMSRMIIERDEGTLRELFMGDWLNQYQNEILNLPSARKWVHQKGDGDTWIESKELKSNRLKKQISIFRRR
ncbi:ISLre2 family transposase [Streptococcus sobrinus]|uniref:ISLre2 family transposase n=1 Tax=Streptococcus sobrinus TaxID=1310 RepID=UPI0002DB765F|nr:ISLre2 family transposase [Streptococcus sobrinus]